MRSIYLSSLLALLVSAIAGAQVALDPVPARVVGHQSTSPAEQLVVSNVNPNFAVSGGLYLPGGVAVDNTGSSPILYVADTWNNRVLAWKNATSSTLANLQAPDMILGQPNAYTTLPAINGGLHYPTGLVVDGGGNLYVADSGNNRILRYPKPLGGGSSTPDIVLGQPDQFTSSRANQGGALSAKTICLYIGCPRGNGPFLASLAVDSSGDLFVADAGNGRVLRYPSGSLTSGAVDPAADSVIGQQSFTVVNFPTSVTDKTTLYTPAGVAIDSSSHIFITDNENRVVVFSGGSLPASGPSAIGFAGIVNPPPATATGSTLSNPGGIVMVNNGPAVVDSGDSRILFFDPFISPDWGTTPAATAVLGQGTSLTNFTSTSANAGNPQASFTNSSGTVIATFNNPFAAAVSNNGDLFVADLYNNRVLVYPNAGTVAAASAVLGQSGFPYNSPNSIHGKEFYFGSSSTYDAGMAVDASSGTPHLFVSDPNNHRVLGFNDARTVAPGVQADIVIGEPDFNTSLCNFGGVTNAANESLPRQPTSASLCYPTGLAVDPSGNLYVADTGNGRVLRFPAPFDPSNSAMTANLVLGQTSFTGISNPQASQTIMAAPYGVLFDAARGLFVSDQSANRVLLFPIGATSSNGESATTVFGQSSFSATGSSILNSPHHIAEDSIGELYVADAGHNQILIFDIQPGATTVTQAIDSFTGLNYPEAVWVNPNKISGYQNDIWVGDSNLGISRFSPPNPLVTGGTPTVIMPAVEVVGPSVTCSLPLCAYPAIAITQDNYGDLYVADTSNRVSIHYPGMAAQNSGSYLCYMGCTLGKENIPCLVASGGYTPSCGMAPGTYVTLYPNPANFSFLPSGASAAYASSLPLPPTLEGLEVLINGQQSPLSVITPPGGGGYLGQINFLVPYEAPTSGTAQVVVLNTSTMQVLASGSATMASSSPAFFFNNGAGTGQIAALNCNNYKTGCENTRNGTNSPANPGAPIQLFMNGAGAAFSGTLPPDGMGSSGTLSTQSQPEVYIGSSQATVDYSGLAPGIPGLWQINVTIPANPQDLEGFIPSDGSAPTVFPVQILYEGFASNYPSNNGSPTLAGTITITAQQ